MSASRLTVAQGAILASMLPAPRKRSPSSGSKALRRRAHWLVDQMRAVKRLTPEQADAAHDEIDERLGWKKKDAAESGGAEEDES